MKKYNIFIDTTEFVSSNFDIYSTLFSTIKDLCLSEKVKLITSDITIQEIYANINEAISNAASSLKKTRKEARILRNIKNADYEFLFKEFENIKIYELLKQKIDTFFQECSAEIIEATKVSPTEIFKAYFKSEAPFSTGNKKSEFPDAFVITALNEWCIKNKENIYIVSNDNDFKNALNNHKYLKHIASIGKFIETVLSDETSLIEYLHFCIEKNKSKLFSFIVDEIKQYEVLVEDADPDAEGYIEEALISEVNELSIIKVTETSAIIEANISVELEVNVNCCDPDSWYKDSDDKSIHYWDKIEDIFHRETDIEVQIQIEFLKEIIQNFEITKVVINRGELLSFYLNEYDYN